MWVCVCVQLLLFLLAVTTVIPSTCAVCVCPAVQLLTPTAERRSSRRALHLLCCCWRLFSSVSRRWASLGPHTEFINPCGYVYRQLGCFFLLFPFLYIEAFLTHRERNIIFWCDTEFTKKFKVSTNFLNFLNLRLRCVQ